MAGDTEIVVVGRRHIQQLRVSYAEELRLKLKADPGSAGQSHDLVANAAVRADDAQGTFVAWVFPGSKQRGVERGFLRGGQRFQREQGRSGRVATRQNQEPGQRQQHPCRFHVLPLPRTAWRREENCTRYGIICSMTDRPRWWLMGVAALMAAIFLYQSIGRAGAVMLTVGALAGFAGY